jgi:hypothetical protein
MSATGTKTAPTDSTLRSTCIDDRDIGFFRALYTPTKTTAKPQKNMMAQ